MNTIEIDKKEKNRKMIWWIEKRFLMIVSGWIECSKQDCMVWFDLYWIFEKFWFFVRILWFGLWEEENKMKNEDKNFWVWKWLDMNKTWIERVLKLEENDVFVVWWKWKLVELWLVDLRICWSCIGIYEKIDIDW